MAAEKLTKKRLIQILVMLAILLSAFFYRSCHYQKQQTTVQVSSETILVERA
ncbi:hypothetical protein [Gallibacterium salpingitidis]|uniref:hypothetical protein n=1 Tax=Gallibacterium salpingitidis TaxID=505341 RepID=UPI000AA0AE36|nr:hypothetical protein [Gallibacterium salpingitidis]